MVSFPSLLGGTGRTAILFLRCGIIFIMLAHWVWSEGSPKPDSASVRTLPDKKIVSPARVEDLLSTEGKTVLTPKDWEGKGKNLPDLLREVAGVQTRKYGGEGSFQTVSLRGIKGSKVRVYLDNVPLNSAGGGAVDLGKVHLNQLARVEIYKGITPARFGGNSVGGVVHLITKGREQRTLFGFSSTAGSHGTYKPEVSARFVPHPAISVFADLGYVTSRNDFEYLDRNGTSGNEADDTLKIRQNSQYNSVKGFIRTEYAGEAAVFEGFYRYAFSEGGIPGAENQQTRTAGFSDGRHDGRLGLRLKFWEKRGVDTDLGISQSIERSRYHWGPDDGLGYSGRDSIDAGEKNYQTGSHAHVKIHAGQTGVDLWIRGQYELLSPVEHAGPAQNPGWENQRTSASTAIDFNYSPVKQIELTMGLQAEGTRSLTGGGVSYLQDTIPRSRVRSVHPSVRLGTSARLTESFSALVNYGWYYRLPSLFEMYGGKGGILANPDLIPERGHNAETGLRWSRGKHYWELTGFYNQNINSVIFINSANLWKPVNLDRARIYGFEVQAQVQAAWWWVLSSNATFQVPENISGLVYKGNQLPDEPVYSQWARSEWGPWRRVKGSYTLEYRSRIFRDEANLQPLPAQRLDHVILTYLFSRNTSLHFAVNNIRDVFYEDAYRSFPYPGRQYFLSFYLNAKWL